MGASFLITVSWAFVAYLVVSFVFAALFALEPNGVEGAEDFTDLVWFSVQTLSTIGYGGMTPETAFINMLVILESFIGLAGVAVVTAILYAKFSLPEARVQFSSTVAIHDYEGQPTLHLRLANERTTPVLDAEIHVGVLVDESTPARRFLRMYDLDLVRSKVPLFAMSFTAMHILEENSPIRRLAGDTERIRILLVTFRGTDARTLQPVFARELYHHHQVKGGVGFDDMISYDENGLASMDLRKLDDLIPCELTPIEDASNIIATEK
ncbi:MAG: potassium channel family protein [Myxococcota bacterium]